MKKIFTLLLAASFGTLAIGQTVFQSDLSSWAGGNPTGWFGSSTSIAQSAVTEVAAGANYGSSMAQLINSTTSHKRFTTENVQVVAGTTYEIKIWVAGLVGDLRTNYYDVTNSAYGSYNGYVAVVAGPQSIITQSVTLPATCDSAQFILSLRNTDANGILIDSVSVTAGSAPVATPYSIYDIQYSTATPADSPHNTELVETSGVVTAVQYNGYYLQDGNGSWNGVFVLDYNNAPSIGDDVSVTGTVDEYFDFTTIKNIIVYNATAGGTLPTATSLSTLGVNNEQYEGVLVSVTAANCTADTTSNTFREWTVNDASGDLVIDDKMYIYSPTVSTLYNVTGVLDYAFSTFKLLPRVTADVTISTNINELENIAVSVYPNPVKNVLNFKLDINSFDVKVMDVTGKVVKRASSLSNKLSLSTTNMNNGIYFYSITDEKGNFIQANRFVVAK
ncbi:T9SS type A sorting domain-containing protein [Vicingaceae bacterium]|nr:T9SS type A sorting domain-containing protein [Vicingaceae bacterium]